MNQEKGKKYLETLSKAMIDSIEIINHLNIDELIALNKMIIFRLREIKKKREIPPKISK